MESVEQPHQQRPVLADDLPLRSLPGTETIIDIQSITENPMGGAVTPYDSQPSCQQHAAGLQTPQHLPHMQHTTVAALGNAGRNAVSLPRHAATACMSGRPVASVVCSSQQGSGEIHQATARAETKQAAIASAPCLVCIAACIYRQ